MLTESKPKKNGTSDI